MFEVHVEELINEFNSMLLYIYTFRRQESGRVPAPAKLGLRFNYNFTSTSDLLKKFGRLRMSVNKIRLACGAPAGPRGRGTRGRARGAGGGAGPRNFTASSCNSDLRQIFGAVYAPSTNKTCPVS